MPHGHFVVRRLELAMISPNIKFEVSMFTHYEYVKDNAKCRN